MVAEISILVFWTAFFGALSTKKYFAQFEDPVCIRMNRLVKQNTSAESELLISSQQTKKIQNLRERLTLAGLHRKKDLDSAVRLRHICQISPFAIMLFLFFLGFPTPQLIASGILFGIIFILVPRIWILHSIVKRRKELERHLPSTIDLLTLCLEAGMSFDTSLIKVAEEQKRVSSHISREFILTNQEILAGKSREEALRNLAWRSGIDEMKSLVGAIVQSIKLGTNLVHTLRTQAQALRKKRRENIRALILKTPVKLIFPLLFFIFPTLLLIILGPSLINIFRHLSAVGY